MGERVTLQAAQVASALESMRSSFGAFDDGVRRDLDRCALAYTAFGSLDGSTIEKAISAVPFPGARPTNEHGAGDRLMVPFGRTWANHQEARVWARGVLEGVPTFAVDGSQIPAQRDWSVPVAVVQVGWFENAHDPAGRYEKNVSVVVLSPDELAETSDTGDLVFPELVVNLLRFEAEVGALIHYIERHRESSVKPLCFFDGSLVLSFARLLRPLPQARYVQAVCRLIAASESCRVPLVGYIDLSYAKDLVGTLACLNGWDTRPRVSDAALIEPLLAWGDRSHAYLCARDDQVLCNYVESATGRSYVDGVCFTYLQTSQGHPPARLDFPRWMLDDGVLDRAIDLVRAECVVGNGYPYTLESADAVAVITVQDRARFYKLFQSFVENSGRDLRYARKALSKRRRRV